MTDPHDKNDDWADLLQELGVEGAEQPSKAVAAPVPEPEASPVVDDEGFAPVDTEEAFGFEPGEDLSDSEDDSAEGDQDGDGDGEEGDDEPGGEGSDDSSPDEPGKKKRRRRRRRRKKGAPETPEAGEAPIAEAPADEKEDVEEEAAPVVAEETLGIDEITPEATREMIAKWNVPSWSELVAGLYRPER